MEKRPKGITVLGIIAIILNLLYLSPFALLLGIPTEGDTLLKIPLAAIPFGLSLLGIFCGVNLIRRVKLQLTLAIIKVTIIYYFLLIISAIMLRLPDIVALILLPIILNGVILWIVYRPKVKAKFAEAKHDKYLAKEKAV